MAEYRDPKVTNTAGTGGARWTWIAAVIVVLLAIAWFAGLFGGHAPEPMPAEPPAATAPTAAPPAAPEPPAAPAPNATPPAATEPAPAQPPVTNPTPESGEAPADEAPTPMTPSPAPANPQAPTNP